MATVSNILFDIGNVILDLDIPGARAHIAEFRLPQYSDETFIQLITPAALEFEIGAIEPEAFVDVVLQHTRKEVSANEIVDAWNGMLLTIPEYRLGMLTALRERFTLIALSNTNALHLDQFHAYLETSHGISDFESEFFDDVYYSHVIGARKPTKKAFKHVIEDALITPRKTLFIDDVQENLDAAAALGFQTLHSPADEEVAETLKLLGYY